MKIKYILIIIIIVLLYILLKLFIKKKEYFINDENPKIEIVISRYNENLEWLKKEQYSKYNIICYNSGNNNNFYNPENMKVIKIDNIGKEAYTYIYHIIKNYDNLADITIFLPGSTNAEDRDESAKILIDQVEKHKNTIFISHKYDNVQENLYDFQIDSWCSTSNENSLLNNKCELNLSKIRPFGKWYESNFTGKKTEYVNYRGLLAIHKKHIIQNEKEYYKNLLKQFNHPNDEIGHYFERSWQAIFHPMNDAVFYTEF